MKISLLLAIITLSAAASAAPYGGGTGEPNDPYLIYTPEQMNAIGAEPNDWGKCFKLMADIDVSRYRGEEFNIIGVGFWSSGPPQPTWVKNPFTGTFDGNHHAVSNLSLTRPGGRGIGLFGIVGEGANIKDLNLIDPNIHAEMADWIGLLAGTNEGTITNCVVQGGSILGRDCVGGLVGCNFSERLFLTTPRHAGSVTECRASATVVGWSDVGGLVGHNDAVIHRCSSNGSVSGDGDVGGLAGSNSLYGEITNCYSASPVKGNQYIGGLAGSHLSLLYGIANCHATGRVEGRDHVGGLIGFRGGFVLYDVWSDVAASFWDVETSGQMSSAGGTGKTTIEMKTSDTFTKAGWDFADETLNGTNDIWRIDEGKDYPRLSWEPE